MASKYVSKSLNNKGFIEYTDIENDTWARLIKRQLTNIENRASQEFMQGLANLNLPLDRVPQHSEITEVLQKYTGWSAEVVPALIPADEFFTLLANKKFPVASFIRIPEEFDYLEEPDIFHEIFGHCPLLTNQAYADFMQWYGVLALKANSKDRFRLFRLFWFTIEFGLIKENGNFRAYGGGILSSPKETIHSIDNNSVVRNPLTAIDALRTPYRIDIVQPLYYYIEKLSDLYEISKLDLLELVNKSRELGNFDPLFPSKEEYLGDGYHGNMPC
jgi:phenylalanine-4-hydroxylase